MNRGVKRIIFSSTRGWNPGDEFILEGVRNVLRGAGIDFVEILYNRHPGIRTIWKGWDKISSIAEFFFADNPDLQLKKIKDGKKFVWFDNSFFPTEEKVADYVIFAGTPEWAGPRNRELYEYALEHRISGAFLGVGLKNKLGDLERRYISELAEIIITRDDEAQGQLAEFGAVRGVCPALFSAPSEKIVEKIGKVGIVFQGSRLWANSIPSDLLNRLVPVYREIARRFEVELICHHFADYVESVELFGDDVPIYYSSRWEQLLDRYSYYDLVVGTRLHGIGAAAAWGVPGILVAHDDRTRGAGSFLEIVASPERILNVIDETDFVAKSRELIDHKRNWFKRYLQFLDETSVMMGVK